MSAASHVTTATNVEATAAQNAEVARPRLTLPAVDTVVSVVAHATTVADTASDV